jgi:hypothetical protein
VVEIPVFARTTKSPAVPRFTGAGDDWADTAAGIIIDKISIALKRFAGLTKIVVR